MFDLQGKKIGGYSYDIKKKICQYLMLIIDECVVIVFTNLKNREL